MSVERLCYAVGATPVAICYVSDVAIGVLLKCVAVRFVFTVAVYGLALDCRETHFVTTLLNLLTNIFIKFF